MKSYAGQDLRQLDGPEGERCAAIIRTVLAEPEVAQPRSIARMLFEPRPWFVWRSDGDEPLTVLCEVTRTTSIPGEDRVRLCVFGRFGQKLSDVNFSTGWRCSIHDIVWEPAGPARFCSMRISTTGMWGGGGTQNYALIGHEFALIRFVDEDGKDVDSIYHNPKSAVGPPAPDRSEDQWAAALGSRDSGEVLRTLAWLGNPTSEARKLDEQQVGAERFKDAAKAGRVRACPDVRSRLVRLTAGADPWIAQAARIVLHVSLQGRVVKDASVRSGDSR